MRVFQISGSCAYGDAVGNSLVIMKEYINEAGYITEIFANNIDKRWPQGTAKKISEMPQINRDDVLIYHYCSNGDLNTDWIKHGGFHVMMFRNITPPDFFVPFNEDVARSMTNAIDDIPRIKYGVDECIVRSEFSKNDLIKAGYDADRISVIPSSLIPFEDYSKHPDIRVLEKYSDGYVNILFVGRIAPNKKHEDIIRAFAEYKRSYNSKARLILVGKQFAGASYANHINSYINSIGVQDIVLPKHVSFSELIAFYKTADIFLCMSEHEGFCVPLVEAMYFDIPIIAYNKTAVPETLGGCGILIDDKNPVLTASIINKVVTDDGIRQAVCKKQKERLDRFNSNDVTGWLSKYLRRLEVKLTGGPQ